MFRFAAILTQTMHGMRSPPATADRLKNVMILTSTATQSNKITATHTRKEPIPVMTINAAALRKTSNRRLSIDSPSPLKSSNGLILQDRYPVPILENIH
jgi:hypothetical protein